MKPKTDNSKGKAVRCTCNSAFQDERYGKGLRYANRMADSTGGAKRYRCTVCGAEHGG